MGRTGFILVGMEPFSIHEIAPANLMRWHREHHPASMLGE